MKNSEPPPHKIQWRWFYIMSDRKTVLKLVQEGKLTAEQAEVLLAKLEIADFLSSADKVKTLRIKMEESKTGKVLWDESVPIGLIKLGLKMGGNKLRDAAKKYPDLKYFNFNLKEILVRLSKDEPGQVATLISQDGAKQLHIWLE